MNKYGYVLEVYRKDRRCTSGERLVLKKEYLNYSGNAMMDEIYALRQKTYRIDKYRLDFSPL